ncbi:MAG: phospholipase [Rubrivivax sp.]|nr:phospholipase [Rubrivivax sp.]
MPALQVFAGPRARARLLSHGLQPQDVRAVPAAAGGAKGLTLLPLDRYLFGHWLPQSTQTVHLLGASIGAWRMAAACMPDADAALATLAEDYITQSYPHAPGRLPTAAVVSQIFGQRLQERLGPQARDILNHPRYRLHVFASRGRGLLHKPGRLGMPLGWVGAYASNALRRRSLGGWLERVVFSDPRDALPLPLSDFRSHQATLTEQNLCPAVLASCAIPFVLQAVQDVPGGPAGSYWDGGITDYHLHLNYAAMADGLVLYPHFIPQVVPGWLDKAWKRRHRASAFLDNLVLLSPSPEWVASLPGGKLPDRRDFKTWGDDHAGRQRVWRRAYLESQRLADEFAEMAACGRPVQALPLA